MENKIAVIIPAYKDTYLLNTLISINNQTDKKFNLYICNDSSPYNIEKVLADFKKINKIHFEYIKFENNLGGSDLIQHWNRCINQIKNEEWIWLFSKIVFNTPAVHFCHGWKLGEYFCLGKIILSTNFQNNIPNGIQDRKNILFVDPKNIEEIINTITNDISFQNELQQNALSYWKNSACPQKVIEHLISYSNRKL